MRYYKKYLIQNILFYFLLIFLISGCIIKYNNLQIKTNQIKHKNELNNKSICYFQSNKIKPSWVENPIIDSQYLYGVGIAPEQKPLTKQYKAAEIIAKNEISKQIVINIEGKTNIFESSKKSEPMVESYIIQKTKAVLYHCEVVDSWLDDNNCLVYVLVRIKKSFLQDFNSTLVD